MRRSSDPSQRLAKWDFGFRTHLHLNGGTKKLARKRHNGFHVLHLLFARFAIQKQDRNHERELWKIFFFEGNEIQTTNYYLEPGTRLDLEASSARASNYFLNMRHETPIFFSKFHYLERAIKWQAERELKDWFWIFLEHPYWHGFPDMGNISIPSLTSKEVNPWISSVWSESKFLNLHLRNYGKNIPSHRRTQSSTALKNPESSEMLKIARTGRQPGNWSNIITGCKYSNPGNSNWKRKEGEKK